MLCLRSAVTSLIIKDHWPSEQTNSRLSISEIMVLKEHDAAVGLNMYTYWSDSQPSFALAAGYDTSNQNDPFDDLLVNSVTANMYSIS